jgi:putative transposase
VINPGDQADGLTFPIREPDATFTAAFDTVFTAPSAPILKTPVRAPRANPTAERRIGSARPGRMLITSERHRQPALREHAGHHTIHRPHRPLQHDPPAGHAPPPGDKTRMRVLRRDRAGSRIHEYALAA